MPTVYLASDFAAPMPSFPRVGVTLVREFLFTLTAALGAGDTIKLCPIPGATDLVLDQWFLDVPDLDSNATPLIALQLGDGTTADKFMAAGTVGQSAGKVNSRQNGVAGVLPLELIADAVLTVTVSTGPATGASTGSIRGFMEYHMVGAPSPA